MSSETIQISVTCYNGRTRHPQELGSSIARAQIHTLASKANLAAHVLAGSRFGQEPLGELNFERKSKKHKGYVPLESEADFKEFLRSLKVKNAMKLVVRTKNEIPQPSTGPSLPLPGIETVDQFRRLITEFQKSEIYEFMKSFSSLYTQAMAPDECSTSSELPAYSSAENVASREESVEKHADSGIVHEGILCDQCCPEDNANYIRGWRYKCTVCDDFDLCAPCYEKRVNVGAHSTQHAVVAIEDTQSYSQFLKARGFRNPNLYGGQTYSPEQVASRRKNAEHASKMHEEACENSKLAQKYRKLEALVEGDDKLETLMALVRKAQQAEKDAAMAQEMDTDELDGEAPTPEEVIFAEEIDMAVDAAEPMLAEVAVVPKGKSMTQILLINKGDVSIDCTGLTLSIVNCFDMTVASIPIEKRNGIAPRRTSKFNVAVSNTHYKYPFKIVLSSARLAGEASLSLKNMSGQILLIPKYGGEERPTNSAAADLGDSRMEMMAEQAPSSSSPSFATASVHSILLPSLPKEVASRAVAAHESSSVTSMDLSMSGHEEGSEDYDLISVTEAEDLDSDYEVVPETQPAS
ncbi:hypothetical protein OXX59_003389 [Metschnikowia pulcherrima]